MNEWIEHDGGDRPVPGDTLVYVKFRNGFDDTLCAKPVKARWWNGTNWSDAGPFGIVAYKVVKS